MRLRPVQLALSLAHAKPARARGRKRAGALLPHVAREPHRKEHPVHVTMRRVATGPSFRAQRVCAAIREIIADASKKGVRVLHYSVQDNHLHLMVEGKNSADLSNQMRTLFSRIAFAVNAVARRHGKLFRERHHRHALTTPREVRNALVYILFNDRKHRATGAGAPGTATLDPCSSAWWFSDWAPWDRPPEYDVRDGPERPTSKPETWLARFGWRWGLGRERDGRIRFRESLAGALAATPFTGAPGPERAGARREPCERHATLAVVAKTSAFSSVTS